MASVMAFGSGVLISAVAFDLMAEAVETGGLGPTALGFLAARWPTWPRAPCSPAAAPGTASGPASSRALLDGVPESVVLGIELLAGGAVRLPVLAAVFISHVPEGLSSAGGMKRSGRSACYVFGVWPSIALVRGLSALIGYVALRSAAPEAIAVITAVAAGAILTMIADTAIPEAFERTRTWTGLITARGFLLAFAIEQV